jgi:hypothetical protein
MNYGSSIDVLPNEGFNDEDDDHNDFNSNDRTSPFQPTYYDDIPIMSSSRKLAPRNDDCITEEYQQQIDVPHNQKVDHYYELDSEVSVNVNSSIINHSSNINRNDAERELDGTQEYPNETFTPFSNFPYESHDPSEHRGNNGVPKDDIDQSSDLHCYDYDVNAPQEFSLCREQVPIRQRTYYLASSTEETTKMSSLSRKLQMDQRRSIVLQASDTSFSTTKSGATQATSHSTSTGISRSSRKTQELIRRFERHGLQKAGQTSTMYNKGAIKLPK